MKVLFHNVYDHLNKTNALFESDNTTIGDDLLKPMKILAETAKKENIIIGTYDKIPMDEADAVFFIDYPNKNDFVFEYFRDKKIPLFLITFESPIIKPEIFIKKLHFPFLKIFTWSDDLVEYNSKKYIKINFASEFKVNFDDKKRDESCLIIAGNKKSNSKNELYSERLKCIKWFDRNSPNKLHLYGFDWDIVLFSNDSLLGRIFNKVNRKFKIYKTYFKIYKGTVKRKYDVLSKYNFCICLENVAESNGWITEKIFDCFFSGTIPIFKGAPNIIKHIPQNCFINYDDFSSPEEISIFLSGVSENEISEFRTNIREYIMENKNGEFSITYFKDTILKEIKKLQDE